ncbi:MAG: lysophospholipid acyltransferase family protein [Moraxellaceae bacterium]|nr:lysophospholipid acyltransferase family protein [Moraxellaceae bacterium]MDP1776232.1 lysophospholipid acyltransferase family protein [Moraxellaceae bacterium]MDZ4297268.1 lysophospholipid acyltransferase family protein [Moraxellaceae bacterium]MDZ4387330.1 lysophospholipid acyltransferase family protein [Moraxellaceae bacterium]
MSRIQKIIQKALLKPDLVTLLDQAPNVVGSMSYDRWGLNPNTQRTGLALGKILYDYYFRTQAYGLENIPASGRVLIIGNHSGHTPIDGILIGVAMSTNPHGPRIPRAMVERLFPRLPYLGNLVTAVGGVVGEVKNCHDMLLNEEAVMVFPEGARGTGKGYAKRYQLQRFGQGFMHLAMETNTPIIPVGVVGCEEALPMYGNLSGLARMLSVPYIPVTTPLPLPYKVHIHFGEPMTFDGPITSESQVSSNVELVRQRIESLLDKGQLMRQAGKSA